MSHLCDRRTSEDEVPCVTCKWLAETRTIELVKKHEPIWDRDGFVACLCGDETNWLSHFEALIKGKQK